MKVCYFDWKIKKQSALTLWGWLLAVARNNFSGSQNPLNIKILAATKSFNVLITHIFPRFRTRARAFFAAHTRPVPRFKFPRGIPYEKVFNLPLSQIYGLIYSVSRKAYL